MSVIVMSRIRRAQNLLHHGRKSFCYRDVGLGRPVMIALVIVAFPVAGTRCQNGQQVSEGEAQTLLICLNQAGSGGAPRSLRFSRSRLNGMDDDGPTVCCSHQSIEGVASDGPIGLIVVVVERSYPPLVSGSAA